MTISSTFRGGLCGLTLALSFGVAHAADLFVPSQYPTIQGAINAAASSGDRVLVADGIYFEHDISYGQKSVEIRSVSDNPAACIVDAQQLGRGFLISSVQSGTTALRGFTVRNGKTTSTGGGIDNRSSAAIANCIFTNNSARSGGGLSNNSGAIRNCVFTGNVATANGGGAHNAQGVVVDCIFSGNAAGSDGGGVYNQVGTVRTCIVSENTAQNYGGGVASSGFLLNCLITKNSSGQLGGGAYNANVTNNCTIIENTSGAGGGIYNQNRVGNCIVYGNSATNISTTNVFNQTSSGMTKNLIEGFFSTPDANGNFGGDPNFVNPAAGDYRLAWPSPAIDRGDNAGTFGFTADLDGSARISRGTVDLGAYEYQDLPVFIDAGPDQTVTVPHDGNPTTNTASVTLNAVVYDPEGAVVTFQWSGNNAAYPPNVNPTVALPAGVYTFTLSVTLPDGSIQTRFVKITVKPEPNGVPSASDKNVSIKQGTSASVDVTATDPDGDPLTYRLLSNAVNGTASLRGTTLTFTPKPGFLGTERIAVGVQDGYPIEALINVYVTVTDGIAPVITLNGSDPMTVGQGATFTDPGATATDNVDGSVPVDVSGSVDTTTAGSYTLTYTATDAAGNSSTKTRTVNVADTTPPTITLNGSDPMTVAQGSAFTDPGATATDNVDGNIPVSVSGSVDTNTVGTYTLTYTATDAAGNRATKTRTVNVVDATAPVITLNGSDPMNVTQGTTFTDPGATAIDNVDGSVPVSVSGSVNTATVGSYTLTYTATDAAGNRATKTRTVNVVAPVSASKIVVSLKEIEGDDDCGRSGGEVEAEFVLRNTGTVAEDNVTITSVSLGGKSPQGKLPKNLGTIKPGKKEEAEFEFKGVKRGTYTLTLSGTSSKGSFTFTQSVTVR